MTVEEWLGKDNTLGQDIFNHKYLYTKEDGTKETFDEWLDRVSAGNEAVKDLIVKKQFLFGGRILANRGLEKYGVKTTYSNCYVITPPEDNIESIFETAKKMARTYSYGGGVGVDISGLAPNGAKVHNASRTSSGACSFMDLYSTTTGLIGQNGRRGALMISLSCEHPDIEEFLDIKKDLNRVTKANISVRMTDKFMEAAKEGKEVELSFTRETGETIKKTVNAREILMHLAQNNWEMAEPGCLFWDRIQNWNLVSEDPEFEFGGVNPCFSKEMRLLTTEGYKTFGELEGKEVDLINADGNRSHGKVWCSGEKETIILKTSKYCDIVCTPNHRFLGADNKEYYAYELKGKKIKTVFKTFFPNHDRSYLRMGYLQGDGTLTTLKRKNNGKRVDINIGRRDRDILPLFNFDECVVSMGRTIFGTTDLTDKMIELGFSIETLPFREFPKTYDSWPIDLKAAFLSGMYSANGCIISSEKDGRISYKTSCYKLAKKLHDTLANDFGLSVYVTTNKSTNVLFRNGYYDCRTSYDVNIANYHSQVIFANRISFWQYYKRAAMDYMLSKKPTLVRSIHPGGIRKVYDFTEPLTHWGIVEGVVAHNCAEEPLPAGGSCLLGSINLAEFVYNDGHFMWDEFQKTVRISIRALNDVLIEGLPLHPLKEQRDSVRDWRQIGLGIMGLADMLIKMGIRYGSEEAVEVCDMIGRIMARTALEESCIAASDKEPYPKFKLDKIVQSDYFTEHVRNGDFLHMIEKHGLYNSQLLTIAPTGTLSTMIRVSGGIEPIFANYYTRKTESLKGHDEYYKVYTPIVKEYMDKHGITDDKDLPNFFVTAGELDYKDRIAMQAVWQKHIDAAISSTVNLSNNTTVEDIFDLYIKAWEAGLKGITVFRDGCARAAILSTGDVANGRETNDTPDESKRGYIIPASDDLIGLKRSVVSGCGKLHVEAFFTRDTGELRELFLSKGSKGGCNSFMSGFSRITSLAARGGIPFEAIVDQLQSTIVCPSFATRRATKHDTSRGSSCPNAVGYALIDMKQEAEAIVKALNGDTIFTGKKEETIEDVKSVECCPNCGSKELSHTEGCVTCPACGWSRCS